MPSVFNRIFSLLICIFDRFLSAAENAGKEIAQTDSIKKSNCAISFKTKRLRSRVKGTLQESISSYSIFRTTPENSNEPSSAVTRKRKGRSKVMSRGSLICIAASAMASMV